MARRRAGVSRGLTAVRCRIHKLRALSSPSPNSAADRHILPHIPIDGLPAHSHSPRDLCLSQSCFQHPFQLAHVRPVQSSGAARLACLQVIYETTMRASEFPAHLRLLLPSACCRRIHRDIARCPGAVK